MPFGGTCLVGGEPARISRAPDGQGAPVVMSGGELLVTGDDAGARRALRHWFAARTDSLLRELVPLWAGRLSLRPMSAEVVDARRRWGSCSSRGALRFNYRVSMLSRDVAEYLVVHELCHLRQMNHSPAFWNEVEGALPGAKALRRKLREQERAIGL